MNARAHSSWHTNLRITWAITAKDILDALKNKHALGVVITALFIGVSYSFIPALTALDNPTNVLVYDAAGSPLSTQLKADQALEVYTYPSEAVMLDRLAYGEVPELGLVIPEDFDRTQEPPVLAGYVLYWVSDEEIAGLTREVEAEITRLAGKPVKIQVSEARVIPQPDQHTLGTWVGAALVFMMIYIGLSLIANLMLEEKLSHTLEALLVSPAASGHVVVAKALTGLFYSLIGIAVTMAINYKIVLHWWLLIPTLVIGALFTISLGLIAGSLIEERGQLSLLTFAILLPLFVPVFLSQMSELFPQWLNQVFMLIPTVTFFSLIQNSFSILQPAGKILAQFAWLAAWAVAGLGCAAWVLHRQQRKEAGDQESWAAKIGDSLRPQPVQEPEPAIEGTEPAQSTNNILVLDPARVPVKPASSFRIVMTIAANDIRQSIHNKLILSILLGSVLLVAGNAVLLRMLSAQAASPASVIGASSPVIAMMISITLMTLGVSLVPLLMIEEKEAHTLEALLVSPASYTQVIAGKALAGAIYCLSGSLVLLIAYRFMLIHVELALLAMLLGTAFVVALGLLVGIASSNPPAVGIWSAAILFVLVVPLFFARLGSAIQAPWVETLLAYWPSNAIFQLLNLATAPEVPQGAASGNAAALVLAAAAVYLLAWWRVRRSQQ